MHDVVPTLSLVYLVSMRFSIFSLLVAVWRSLPASGSGHCRFHAGKYALICKLSYHQKQSPSPTAFSISAIILLHHWARSTPLTLNSSMIKGFFRMLCASLIYWSIRDSVCCWVRLDPLWVG